MSEEKGGDLVVRILKAAGVEVVFGIISIHNMPIFDAINRQGGIRVIPTRSEPGAVNMADGYARATGKLGVAITSTGAGAGNAAGSLVEAQTAGTPLLHLTGQIDSPYLDQGKGFIHECKDQYGMLKALSKEAYRVRSAATLGSTLQSAIDAAFAAPSGLISVEIPIDIQKAPQAHGFQFQSNAPVRREPDTSLVHLAAEMLTKAKRPLIWSGGGVINAQAEAEVTKLAEKIGAAVVTSQAGRGVMPEDHPQCVGNFAANPAFRPFLTSTDMLLVIGSHMRGQETGVWQLPVPPTIIQIDADPNAISRAYPATVGIVGDAKATVQALLNALDNKVKPDPNYLEEVGNARKAVRQNLRSTLGPYEQICDDLRASMNHEAILVRDITISASTWGSRLFPVYAPRQSIHAAGGGIGQGYQMGLGVKLGQPDKQVVAICGDGGFMVNIGELATMVQENIPLVIVLMNDGGYGVIRNIQGRDYGNRIFAVDLKMPDFGKLAEAYGIAYFPVKQAAEFKSAVQAALATNQPALVEVDMASVGDFISVFAGPPMKA
jgi:acetolactate synthase I/II/III large subunit